MTLEQRAAVMKALGDPTRLRILEFLRNCCAPVSLDEDGRASRTQGPTAGEVCCCITGIDRINSTISFHLKELRNAGLISMERRGKNMVCALNEEAVCGIAEFLTSSLCSPNPKPGDSMNTNDVREQVQEKYGAIALRVMDNQEAGCCGSKASACCGDTATEASSCCSTGKDYDPITRDLYSDLEAGELPEAAVLASLGCGNPTALAQLMAGETVLDLGSGGGIDVLLSAKRVGPTGFAYGLDMTDAMLELAERNLAESGAQNVKFLKGHIESIPLPDASVDVIVSNCVINLSADKDQVLREAFRVLKPGGRFAVSDVVIEGELPEPVRKDMEAYVGCVAGALEREDYKARLAAAGFAEIGIEPTRRYYFADLEGSWAPKGIAALSDAEKKELDGRIMGAFIRATKP